MIKTVSKITNPDELDYETLRLEGIRLIQKLCGNVWTDFNPHDPGITILEQIVFALTDLGYKAGFGIESFLSSKDGTIDYKKEALYTRDQVLRQYPVTSDDYEQFFERELGCDRVVFHKKSPGTYDVRIWPAKKSPEKPTDLISRFSALWREWRNMGEFVKNVSVEAQDSEIVHICREIPFETGDLKPIQLPTGVVCDFMDFFPLIEQFPSIYRYGSSEAELKKYLEPIEALFKVFLQSMQDFAGTFSIQTSITDWARYNRILDQMLAMYGVTFPNTLFLKIREINPDQKISANVYQNLLQAKVTYLNHLPELHLHRGGKWWKVRIEIMLGLTAFMKIPTLSMQMLDGIHLENGFGKVYIVWSSETPFTNTQEKCDGIERFIRDELPAHLFPVFYWVRARDAHTFEQSKSAPEAAQAWINEHKDKASEALWL